MAKRFTDTEKWKKPFIRALPAAYKLLWFYICDDCDHAGIWHVDIEVAEIRTGEKIDLKKAVTILDDKVIVFDDGKKWFLPSFIEFQYPSGLKAGNKVHDSVIQILQKYNLIDDAYKPLPSPFQGAKDKDKDKDQEKDKGKAKDKETAKILPLELVHHEKTIYEKCTKVYFDWFEKMNDVKPKFDGAAGKAMKSIIAYLAGIAKDKNHQDADIDLETLKSWTYILANWGRIDPFIGSQVNLTSISTNINRIITELKNGKKNGKQPTGGEVSTESLAAKIALLTKNDERTGTASGR